MYMGGAMVKLASGNWVIVFYGTVMSVENYLDMLKNSEIDQEVC
jgi:hypothetical protein